MFRRKDEEFDAESGETYIETDETTESEEYTSEQTEETAPQAAAPAAPKAPRATASFRPQPQPASANVTGNRAPIPAESRTPANTQVAPKSSKRVLTVGNDIHMKGEISTCDRLVIEGSVDATLKDVHTVEIAETGSFKGSAEIEDAEISGIFEGDLVVRGRLIVYSTGKLRGSVTYGEIEIERGGQLSGTVMTVADAQQSASGQKKRVAA